MVNITRTDVQNYVNGLRGDTVQFSKLYDEIHVGMLSQSDTMSDEFQILADLDEIFVNYAKKYISNGLNHD